jgi:hypothetical protein
MEPDIVIQWDEPGNETRLDLGSYKHFLKEV